MFNKTDSTLLFLWWNYTYNLPRSVFSTFNALPQHLKLKFYPVKFIHKAQFPVLNKTKVKTVYLLPEY